ncbi:hypothetical protein FIV39_28930, partial [Pseudomonas grimontii]
LPGSFMWQLYRMVLGRDEIPPKSLLDKAPLTWRLMRLLPELIPKCFCIFGMVQHISQGLIFHRRMRRRPSSTRCCRNARTYTD